GGPATADVAGLVGDRGLERDLEAERLPVTGAGDGDALRGGAAQAAEDAERLAGGDGERAARKRDVDGGAEVEADVAQRRERGGEIGRAGGRLARERVEQLLGTARRDRRERGAGGGLVGLVIWAVAACAGAERARFGRRGDEGDAVGGRELAEDRVDDGALQV